MNVHVNPISSVYSRVNRSLFGFAHICAGVGKKESKDSKPKIQNLKIKQKYPLLFVTICSVSFSTLYLLLRAWACFPAFHLSRPRIWFLYSHSFVTDADGRHHRG